MSLGSIACVSLKNGIALMVYNTNKYVKFLLYFVELQHLICSYLNLSKICESCYLSATVWKAYFHDIVSQYFTAPTTLNDDALQWAKWFSTKS